MCLQGNPIVKTMGTLARYIKRTQVGKDPLKIGVVWGFKV